MTKEELNSLRVGRVIRSLAGNYRVVREVNRLDHDKRTAKTGDVHSIAVTIMHCSWTGRGYTVLNRHDLLRNYTLEPFQAKDIDSSEFQKKFVAECNNTGKSILTCCDVKGVA